MLRLIYNIIYISIIKLINCFKIRFKKVKNKTPIIFLKPQESFDNSDVIIKKGH